MTTRQRLTRAAGSAALALAAMGSLVACASEPAGSERVSAAANSAASAPPSAVAVPTPTATPTAAPVVSEAALADGEEPPQFIVVSFDGGGGIDAWQRWRGVAANVDATMTFFLTGLYLVPEEKAYLYDPPGHPRGSSEVGFSAAENVRPRMEQVRLAHAAGHEIGTHYNGHFCGRGGVSSWSSADWRSEIRQFDSFLANWRVNSGATDAPPVGFGPSEIVGGRTPCLEGSRAALYPALLERGFRYDTSGQDTLRWPTRLGNGLWDIPQQMLRMAGSGTEVLSMDWNFYDLQSNAQPAAASRHPAMYRQVLDTYRNAYRAVSTGNRAPLILGSHFNSWNGGIYADALADFVTETCGRPQTRCVSFEELVNWMEAQSPATRAALAALSTQPMGY